MDICARPAPVDVDDRVTRLTVLEVDAVTVDDDGRVALALSDTPVRLREPLAGLALWVADAARGRGSPWLFPSSQGTGPCPPNGCVTGSAESA